MVERNKWIVLVAKLLEATQEDKIRWASQQPPDAIFLSGERADKVYITEFLDRKFRIYDYSFKSWQDDERFEWQEGLKLEFIDDAGHSQFEVPTVAGIGDLLAAVKYQTADIDKFLQDLVG